jgi:hypothetical protein
MQNKRMEWRKQALSGPLVTESRGMVAQESGVAAQPGVLFPRVTRALASLEVVATSTCRALYSGSFTEALALMGVEVERESRERAERAEREERRRHLAGGGSFVSLPPPAFSRSCSTCKSDL